MSLILIFVCIAILVLLITYFKINAFLAFLIVSILAGFLLGIEPTKIIGSVQKGLGDMLGSLIIVVVAGAMLGKLTAESGAAQRIASGMMKLFGASYIQWALLITGFIIGIPLFYNVGFVLVIPLIFSVAQRYNLPVVYMGVPTPGGAFCYARILATTPLSDCVGGPIQGRYGNDTLLWNYHWISHVYHSRSNIFPGG